MNAMNVVHRWTMTHLLWLAWSQQILCVDAVLGHERRSHQPLHIRLIAEVATLAHAAETGRTNVSANGRHAKHFVCTAQNK